MLVFTYNRTSNVHRFRYNQVSPLAVYDVVVVSPLGALQVKSKCILCKGAPGTFLGWILEERPRFHISF